MALIDCLYASNNFDELESQQKAILNARRSLVSTVNLKAGTLLKKEHLTFKRPAFGISPKYIDDVIGKPLLIDLNEDEQLQWEMINPSKNE